MAIKDILSFRKSSKTSAAATSHTPSLADNASFDHPVKEAPLAAGVEAEDPNDYPKGAKLAIIIAALASAVLLVALDQTIVATAIPKITNQFHSVQDIGWYGSAYFLTAAALTTIWGKVYQNFNVKYWFCITVAIFEVRFAHQFAHCI